MQLQMPEMIRICAMLAATAGAVYSDLRYFKIHNRWILAVFGTGCLINICAGIGQRGILPYIAGGGVGFGLGILLYLIHAVGAGDAKLFAVLGLITGWKAIVAIIGLSLLCGGIFGIFSLLVCRRKKQFYFVGKQLQLHVFHYGIAILMAEIIYIIYML